MLINMLKCIKLCTNNIKLQTATLLCNQNNLMMQQSRSTFILKRRYPVPLMKKYQHRPILKHKHYIYDLVEDTNIKKTPKIDIVLLNDIINIGEKGDIISMSGIKAYERYLVPKLAVYATPENIKKYAIQDEQEKKKSRLFSSVFVRNTLSTLHGYCLSVKMSMEVPWTIEKWHISACFRLAGFIVPQHAITLCGKDISGPNLSNENKEFYITVKINNCEETKVRCRLHHFSTDPFKYIYYDQPYWQSPSIAIFPEDQPILDSFKKYSMPKV